MRRVALRLLIPAAMLGSIAPVQAQPILSDEAYISLITILPGDAVYSLFGHSAVRIYDPAGDLDYTFNYGTFDFGNPLVFAGRFSYGKLDYFLSVQSFPAMLDHYWNVEGRPVIEQVLNLTPSQRNALFQFLARNARPEHRYYRYDFFFDNCSTRIRDVLETVLGDSLRFAPEPNPEQSFRHLIDPYLVEQPFLDFGMDLGLGTPADRIATPRETMFLPLHLMTAFDHATVTIDGAGHPLVARTDTLAWSEEQVVLQPSLPWPALLLWILFALGLFVTIRDVRAARTERRLFDGLLFGMIGGAGVVIVFLWFISLHTVTQWNYNLLWAWPFHLVAAPALMRRSQARWLRGYLLATALVVLGVVLGWFFWPQDLPAAVLPLVLLLAVRSAGLTFTRSMKKERAPA